MEWIDRMRSLYMRSGSIFEKRTVSSSYSAERAHQKVGADCARLTGSGAGIAALTEPTTWQQYAD